MNRKSKIALLLLVFALLCSACAVFVGAESVTKTLSYDGSQTPTAGSWPYNITVNTAIGEEGDNKYYYTGTSGNSMRFPLKEFQQIQLLNNSNYSYLTLQVDFRAPNNLQGQEGYFYFTNTSGAAFGIYYKQHKDNGDAYLSNTGSTAIGIEFEDITQWHTLEVVVKLPTAGATIGENDGSEFYVFLDGKEATNMHKNGGAVSSSAGGYPKQFEIVAKDSSTATTGTLHVDNLRSVLYGTGEFFRAEVNETGYENFSDAFAAASADDTVTLLQHMTEEVVIDKPMTVETNGKTFLYSVAEGYKAQQNGTTYTFFEAKPATIEIEVNGEVIETVKCMPDALPENLTTDGYIYPDGSRALLLSSITATVDGVSSDFTTVTDDMCGKTVRLVLNGEFAACAVTKADGTVQYSTDLNEAVTGIEADSLLTLYKDHTITASLTFPALSGTVSFDLNGYAVTVESKMAVITSNCGLNLYSSRKGGKIENTNIPAEGNGNGQLVFLPEINNINLSIGNKNYPKENLTLRGANLLFSYAKAASKIDLVNFVYSNMYGDSQGMIELFYTPTVTIDGCDLVYDLGNEANQTNVGNKALFADRSTVAGETNVTVTNSTLYISGTDRLVKAIIANTTGKHTFNLTFGAGTVLLTEQENLVINNASTSETYEINFNLADGVKLSHIQGADGITLADDALATARIAPETVTLDGKDYTVSYRITSDYATLTFKDGETATTEIWAKGETPTAPVGRDLGENFYTAFGTLDVVDGDKTYEAKVLSKVSQIKGNLTLYSSLTMNFYIAKNGLVKTISFNGGEAVDLSTLPTMTIKNVEYYVYKTSAIAPKDLTADFTVDLGLDAGVYHVESSLTVYAASVLNNAGESEEGKTLVLALLDYVRAVAVKFGTLTASDAAYTAIGTLIADYSRPAWSAKDVQTVEAGDVFKGAALDLDSTPGFLFFVADDFAGEITVKYGNVTKVYTSADIRSYTKADGTQVSAILVDLAAADYRNLIALTAGEETLTYNLDTYIRSQTTSIAPAYLQALYAYSVAAEAYRNAQ